MNPVSNVYYVGPHQATADQLAERLGGPVTAEFPAAVSAGDVVFLSVRIDAASAAAIPGGNPFVACRDLKQDPQVRVFLLVDEGDDVSGEIGRFCMADGSVPVRRNGEVIDLAVVEACVTAGRQRTPIDDLLEALEKELASDQGRRDSAIQRMLADKGPDWVTEHLSDAATGLFCGPFATFKLEEEFKRASRFHQPLSLILLDIGGGDPLPHGEAERQTCLAEVASVFLNECRDIDVLARFTETTFLFLLPGTGSSGAAVVARRMLAELESRVFGADCRLSPRAGLTTVPAAGVNNRSEFLARAEACLRVAQENSSTDGLCVSCE